MSFFPHVWFPIVTTSVPASNKSLKFLSNSPIPPAAFSPFVTTKSISSLFFKSGNIPFSFLTPASPTMSPTANTFTYFPSFFLF